jgi:hypothetical protein
VRAFIYIWNEAFCFNFLSDSNKSIIHVMFDFLLIHGKYDMNECVVAILKMKIYEISGE